MACVQDATLLRLGIAIDRFRPQATPLQFVCLTHAHFDHLMGLSKTFPSRQQIPAQIVCTPETMALTMTAVKGLNPESFLRLPWAKPYHLLPQVTVTLFPSHHCDGSSMFLFEIESVKKTTINILYTGDFRYTKPEPLLRTIRVDHLYVDDSFQDITERFPPYEHTLRALKKCVGRLQREDPTRPLFLHSGVLGIEMILRRWSKQNYQIAPELRHTYREKQLEYLLGDQLGSTSHLYLGDYRRVPPQDNRCWIVLSATSFVCPHLVEAESKSLSSQRHRIFFVTHSNGPEIQQLIKDLKPRFIHLCQQPIVCSSPTTTTPATPQP